MKLNEAKKIIKEMNLSREDILKIIDMIEPEIITIRETGINYPYVPNTTPCPYTPYKPYEPIWVGYDPFTCITNSSDIDDGIVTTSNFSLVVDKAI